MYLDFNYVLHTIGTDNSVLNIPSVRN